jgi:hypothetical protein
MLKHVQNNPEVWWAVADKILACVPRAIIAIFFPVRVVGVRAERNGGAFLTNLGKNYRI